MNFYEWITQKYLEWQTLIGERKSVTDFAKYIGMSQPTVSSWMQPDGKVPRSTNAINKLVSRFGTEVYDILGLELPMDETSRQLFEGLPEEFRSSLIKAIAESTQEYRESTEAGEALTREELAKKISESMAKYGFSPTDN